MARLAAPSGEPLIGICQALEQCGREGWSTTFCEVLPLSERDIQAAESDHVVKAPVRAKVVVPLQVVPNLIAALQEHMRVFSESTGTSWDKVH